MTKMQLFENTGYEMLNQILQTSSPLAVSFKKHFHVSLSQEVTEVK